MFDSRSNAQLTLVSGTATIKYRGETTSYNIGPHDLWGYKELWRYSNYYVAWNYPGQDTDMDALSLEGGYTLWNWSYDERPRADSGASLTLTFALAQACYYTASSPLIGLSATSGYLPAGTYTVSDSAYYSNFFSVYIDFSAANPLDIVATSLSWNRAQGGVDFTYDIRSNGIPVATTAKLFWANGPNLGDIISTTPIFTQNITVGASGSSAVIHAPAANFATPLQSATYILLVLDTDNLVYESNKGNNLLPLAIPPKPSVLGRVLDSETHALLSGAQVTLGGNQATTGSDGAFIFLTVDLTADVTLSASKVGYYTNRQSVDPPAGVSIYVVPDISSYPFLLAGPSSPASARSMTGSSSRA